VESVGGGQYYLCQSAAGTPRLSGSNPRPRALRQEGRVLRNILIIVYLVIGVVIANSHHYFTHLNSLTSVLSALLAVVLWPLILFGVNLHIK
jgi:Mn2+/Fe2+ NRAMP family transporter